MRKEKDPYRKVRRPAPPPGKFHRVDKKDPKLGRKRSKEKLNKGKENGC